MSASPWGALGMVEPGGRSCFSEDLAELWTPTGLLPALLNV
jgi:hypothetical protein